MSIWTDLFKCFCKKGCWLSASEINTLIADAPAPAIPDQEICTGPFERCTNRTGWWAPAWSPVFNTGNVPRTEDDWVPVGNPVVSPDCVTDLTFDADLGSHLMYLRNVRAYYWVDYRLVVNGVPVLTRSYDKYWYKDERINNATGDEPLQYLAIPISNAIDHRLNIPAGATVGVEARRRYQTVGAQDANYFRVISGLRSQTKFSFTPRELVTGRA